MCTNSLPSSAICKDNLLSVEDILQEYPKLKHESKAGTLACKLAKEAIFGSDVMKQCTPIGNRELPGLPEKELKVLKKTMFTRVLEQQSGIRAGLEEMLGGCTAVL